MCILKSISVLIVLLTSSIAFSQITFEAKLSKKKLGLNERLRVDFEMNRDGDNFTPPGFENFNVVGGPNTSVSTSWINGKKSYKKTYSYFLAPKRKGTFKINQASIEIEGNIYKTPIKSVTVSKAVSKPNDNNNADYVASQNIHLVAEISNTNPYLNEAITVVYKLYVSPTTGVSNVRESGSPEYNDFWSQTIKSKGFKPKNGKYKGEDYRYIEWAKTVLYPQKTGNLDIEPLKLDITVEVPTNRRDFFGGRLMTRVNKTIFAGNRTITVKPLPEQGKPSNFTGAVGDYSFKVTTTKTELSALESLQAQVEVSGKGNLKLFKLPKLTMPSSLEVYEPERNDNIRTNIRGMQGTKRESYTIVPQYKGKYPIPAISFSYFDLKTESYKTLESNEIIVNVIDGPSNDTTADNNITNTGTNKQTIILNSDQFAFIKTSTNFVTTKPSYFFKTNLFWGSLLMPLLAIPLAIIIRKKKAERNADVFGNRIRKADKLARKYLSEAKKALGNKEAFYIALEKALHNYLKAKLHIETSDFSKEKIHHLLEEKQVNVETIINFKGILKNCELARYTPITHVEMKQDYNKASKTISLIDKQVK